MGADLLKTVGAIAGVAGIALGVVFLLFREVIRNKLIPAMPKKDATAVIRLFLWLTWSIGVIGVLAWLITTLRENESLDEIVPSQSTDGSVKGDEPLLDLPDPKVAFAGPVKLFVSSQHDC